jgi:hypothetical protein
MVKSSLKQSAGHVPKNIRHHMRTPYSRLVEHLQENTPHHMRTSYSRLAHTLSFKRHWHDISARHLDVNAVSTNLMDDMDFENE